MKNTKFYGVAGVNAYGVYTDYDKVLASRRFIKKYRLKKFKDFESAKSWAEDNYEMLVGVNYFDYNIPEIKKLNWCYYPKKIERQDN